MMNNYCTLFTVLNEVRDCSASDIEYGSVKSKYKQKVADRCSLFKNLDGHIVAACFCKIDNCNKPDNMMKFVEAANLTSYERINCDIGSWVKYAANVNEHHFDMISCLRRAKELPFLVKDVYSGTQQGNKQPMVAHGGQGTKITEDGAAAASRFLKKTPRLNWRLGGPAASPGTGDQRHDRLGGLS
ncbi:hypothetical protein OESDEN_14727 [Oesophagostomum dentatum]|uniref:Uncharacterized protein n=1 Tax=Oesophagostomum dentatum TaxID=61180 RepID=A0A0B1SKU9_OESDE|nr:hypothetical protein OESDEN_14727 [Oesophagostomum dentatum]